MPAKIKILGPDNIWKYKEVTPEYAEGFFTYYVTSALYPVVAIESLAGNSPGVLDGKVDYKAFNEEYMFGAGYIIGITVETTTYPDPVPYATIETVYGQGYILGIEVETTTYPDPVPYSTLEQIRGSGYLLGIAVEAVDPGNPILYTQWPADKLQGSGYLLSISVETA